MAVNFQRNPLNKPNASKWRALFESKHEKNLIKPMKSSLKLERVEGCLHF